MIGANEVANESTHQRHHRRHQGSEHVRARRELVDVRNARQEDHGGDRGQQSSDRRLEKVLAGREVVDRGSAEEPEDDGDDDDDMSW